MKCPHCGKEIATKPHSILDLKDIRAAKQHLADRMENCNARMTPHGLVWDDDKKRKEWIALRLEIREITKRIATMKP